MRTLALAAVAAIVCLALATPSASAAPPVCSSTTVDGVFVKATVDYGVGVGCVDVGVERCTLQSNPEYPSHPYWTCTRVL